MLWRWTRISGNELYKCRGASLSIRARTRLKENTVCTARTTRETKTKTDCCPNNCYGRWILAGNREISSPNRTREYTRRVWNVDVSLYVTNRAFYKHVGVMCFDTIFVHRFRVVDFPRQYCPAISSTVMPMRWRQSTVQRMQTWWSMTFGRELFSWNIRHWVAVKSSSCCFI